MALEMRAACERCGRELAPGGEALICSFECTFCGACAHELDHMCPNCAGEVPQEAFLAVLNIGQGSGKS